MLRSAWLNRSALVLTVAAMSLPACVSRGRYDELVAENQRLMEQKVELTDVGAQLSSELSLRDQEVAQLEREQQELRDETEELIARGLLTMQLLADGLHLVLDEEVLFATGSAVLKPEGATLLKSIVAELEQIPYEIAVLGYTDNVPIGPALVDRFPSNWELAGARAAAVVRLFQAEGISEEQLVAISFGESHPRVLNDTPEGRTENRRTELRLRPVIRRSGL